MGNLAKGFSHLKTADKERLELLRGGVRLAAVSSEHRADELAAALHAEFPWMAQANEAFWNGMRNSVRRGETRQRRGDMAESRVRHAPLDIRQGLGPGARHPV